MKPGEEAENRWKGLEIEPGKVTDAQYLYNFLMEIEEARQYCVTAGVFPSPPNPKDYNPNTREAVIAETRYYEALEKEMKGLE